MIKTFRRLLFAWRFKRAVRRADNAARLFGMKYLVLVSNGRLRVVPKQAIRELVRRRRFKKGVTVADIEKAALYIASPKPAQPCS